MTDHSSEMSEDRLDRAVAAYAAGIRRPASGLDNAVMARVRYLSDGRRRGLVQWLFAPQRVNIRPIVLAFAASVALLLLWPGRASDNSLASAGTVLVRFELVAPEASTVSLAGSFNSWSQDAIRLVPSSAPGLWTATVALKVGSHEYLFVVDGQRWIADPTAHAQVADGFGQTNSVIVVGPRGVVKS